MHADLRFEPRAGDALHGVIESPVAAANEDAHAVDGDGEVLRVRDGVGDLAHAEAGVVAIGDLAAGLEAEVQGVEILRAVSVGPPELRIQEMERRCVAGIEGDQRRAVRCEVDLLLEGDVAEAALEHAVLGLIGDVLDGGLDRDVGAVQARQRQVGGDERILDQHGPLAERKTFCQMPVSRSRMAGIQSQPMVERKVGPSMAVMPPFLPRPSRDGVLMRDAGMRLGRDQNGEDRGAARLHQGGDVEGAAYEGAQRGADLLAVDPDRGGVIDAVEVEPDMPAGVGLRAR